MMLLTLIATLLVGRALSHECDAYSSMYGQIYDDLKWWYRNKVTPTMMDNAIYRYTMEGGRSGLAFLFDEGKVYFHTNNKLMKDGPPPWHAAEIAYHMEELNLVSEKYGHEIPNVEMVLMVDDAPNVELKTFDDHSRRRREITWAPVGKYFSADGYTHVAVPGWGFHIKHFDDKIATWSQGIYQKYPWETRKEVLFGNYWEGYWLAVGRKDTGEGESTEHIRKYFNTKVSMTHPDTIDTKANRQSSMAEHANHKYLIVLDGIGPSNRYFELLATGSLVFKQTSPYRLHFEGGMKPYEHYLPIWVETPWDAHDMVLWARKNDDIARRIAEAGRAYALKYLSEPARLCYWREVLLQMAKVLAYVPTVETRRNGRPAWTFEEISATEDWRKAHDHYPYRTPVTPEMMDAAIMGYSMETSKPGLAFIFEGGKLFFHTNNNILKKGPAPQFGAEITYHMEELNLVALKYGHEIPNVEMVVMVNDHPPKEFKTFDDKTRRNVDVKWAPIGKYFSSDGYAHVSVPGWGFHIKHFDEKIVEWSRDIYARYPWENRTEVLFGNYWEGYWLARGRKETGEGESTQHIRKYFNQRVSMTHPDTLDTKAGRKSSMAAHANHKYLIVLDGIGPSNRYFELLATGSAIFKQTSPYRLHFEGGMKPYEHYLPIWVETPWDAHDMVLWARENDATVRRIAEAGRAYALKYLSEPARLCYWREVLLQMAKVLAYVPTVETRRNGRPAWTFEEISATEDFKKAHNHYP